MASLVMGVVGAYIGFQIGGPKGAAIGWSIGSSIGASMTELPAIQGARLSDLKAQSSAFGSFIPIVYGTSRISGQVIWSSDLIETSHTESSGGKGGPSQDTTTYTYSMHAAVALCEGVISGVARVWANGKLIGDFRVGAGWWFDQPSFPPLNFSLDSLVDIFSGNKTANPIFRVYVGNETQVADALLESYLGAGNVPANRGMAYVVLENFQLEKFGNRMPNLTFEVIADGTNAVLSNTVLIAPATGPLPSQKIEHPTISGILLYEEVPTTGNIVVYVFDYISGTSRTVDSGVPIAQALTNYSLDYKSAIYVPDTNEFWFGVRQYGDIVAYTIDANALQFGRYITVNSGTWAIDSSLGWRITLAYDKATNSVFFNSFNSTDNTLSGELMNPNDSTYTSIITTSSSFYCEEGNNSIALPQDTDPSSIKMLVGGVLVAQVYAPEGTRYTAGLGAAVYYDSRRKQYVFRLADVGGYIVFMTIKDDGAFGTQTYTTTLLSSLYVTERMRYCALYDSFFITGWGGAGNAYQYIVGISAETFNEVSRASSTGTTTSYWTEFSLSVGKYGYISAVWNYGSEYGLSLLPLTELISSNPPTVSAVVEDICMKVGLTVGDIDTAELASDIVDGYVIGSSMTARSAIEGIQPAFYFDVVESD